MPVAKVYVPAGILTQEQRREIVRGIHEVIVGVEKRPADSPTYVLRDSGRPLGRHRQRLSAQA
jgi:phenylpyruvate tautomerase PptA (4-oxalocrotonate tautomerase family)